MGECQRMYNGREEGPCCPICGHEADTLYKNQDGYIVGCYYCLDIVDAWEWCRNED